MRLYLVISPSKVEQGLENVIFYLRGKNKKKIFSLSDESLSKIINNENSEMLSFLKSHRRIELMGYGKKEEMEDIASKFPFHRRKIEINYGLCF